MLGDREDSNKRARELLVKVRTVESGAACRFDDRGPVHDQDLDYDGRGTASKQSASYKTKSSKPSASGSMEKPPSNSSSMEPVGAPGTVTALGRIAAPVASTDVV